MNNAIRISFSIPCPENILWWAISILFIGAGITSVIMHQAARFTLDMSARPVSTQAFHRLFSKHKIAGLLNHIDMNARTSLARGLRIDFAFMPCLYGLMIAISLLVLRNSGMTSNWDLVLEVLCLLPLGTWLMDVLENIFSLQIIKIFNKGNTVSGTNSWLMGISSILKWSSGIIWLLIMCCLLITRIVAML